MDSIEIEGMEEFEEMLKEMTIDEVDERKAMKKAIKPIADEVEKNTPKRTSRLKKSLKRTVKKEDLATIGIVRFGAFWDVFQEFGTSKSKKNVGFFEKSVNRSQNEATKILGKELLDKIK